jgi:hypothetical protein
MSVRREDKDGEERWWKSLFRHGQRSALAQESPCQDHTIPINCVLCKKKMFHINDNIKMNKAIKAYQIFTFSKKHTEMFMMKKP